MLSIARRALDRIAMAANVCGTLVVLALVVIVNTDVVARGVFSAPFRGSVEVVQFSMVLIVFLQLPDVVRVDRLTRSDGLLTVMANRRPAAACWLSKMINAISAVLMALIAYAIWPEFVDAFETGDYFGTPGVFTAPWWPVKLAIFFSAVLCCMIWIGKVLAGESEKADIEKNQADV